MSNMNKNNRRLAISWWLTHATREQQARFIRLYPDLFAKWWVNPRIEDWEEYEYNIAFDWVTKEELD